MQNKIYIFGAGTNGAMALRACKKHGISVVAFLDNFTEKTVFHELPVLRPAEGDRNIPVVVTSPVFCLDITLQLDWLGFTSRNLSMFYHELGIEPDWAGDLKNNRKEYERTRAMLGDARSIAVFDAVMKFRKTLEPLYPAAVKTDLGRQWFDRDFFVPGPHVFVDGGGYNGDTAEEFIRQCPAYRSVYVFEPSRELFNASADRLGAKRDVRIFNHGLSDKMVQCHLEDAGLPGGRVGVSGEKISLLPLDTLDIEQPTFIKLDIEGCEKEAIRGAGGHIRRGKPFLAVAVYHKPEDIWEIPRLLSGMQNYKFYLRHYTQFYHETVLYAV